MRDTLFLLIIAFCVSFGTYFALPHPAAAVTTAEGFAAQETQKVEEFRDRIKEIKDVDERKLADTTLDFITGKQGNGVTNPNDRQKLYDDLGWTLIMTDEKARIAALEALAKKLGYKVEAEDPKEEDEKDPTKDDEKTKPEDEQASAADDLKKCQQQGGSWSASGGCKAPQVPLTPPGSGGLVGGKGSGSGQPPGSGSPGGPSSTFNPGSNAGYDPNASLTPPDPSGNGKGVQISEPSQCGPKGITKLEANTLPEERAKMCLDTAKNLMSAVESTCSGQMDKPVEQRSGECQTLSKDVENTYKEAAGFSQDKDKRKEICGQAKEKFQSNTDSWEECKPPKTNCLAKAREKVAAELTNSGVAAFFDHQIQSEVGGQGRAAQIAYIESVMNRSMSRLGTSVSCPKKKDVKRRSTKYSSFYATAQDVCFYPAVSLNYERTVDPNRARKYDDLVKFVLSGSNTCKYCTGNGSSGVGAGRTTAVIAGETFGVEEADTNWMNKKLAPMCGGAL